MKIFDSRESVEIYERTHNALIRCLYVLLTITAICAVIIPIRYNHWIGWDARLCFWAVSLLVCCGIFGCLAQTFNVRLAAGKYPSCYLGMIVVLFLLAIEIALAGYDVRFGAPCYDISSGKLQVSKATFVWANPFANKTVLLRKSDDRKTISTGLFPGREIAVKLKTSIKLETPADLLFKDKYLGSPYLYDNLFGVFPSKSSLKSAYEHALLASGITVKEAVSGRIPAAKERKLLNQIRKEINASLPDYLDTKGAQVTLEPVKTSD